MAVSYKEHRKTLMTPGAAALVVLWVMDTAPSLVSLGSKLRKYAWKKTGPEMMFVMNAALGSTEDMQIITVI